MTDRVTVKHWTERSTDDFLYKLGADFVAQIEKVMDDSGVSQAALAGLLGVSKGRVSQVLSNPGNITLRNVVQYARALGRKVSVVAYDDDDSGNERGLINAEVLSECWKLLGKPADFFELEDAKATMTSRVAVPVVPWGGWVTPGGFREVSTGSEETFVISDSSAAEATPGSALVFLRGDIYGRANTIRF